jgi:hypothetical protein
MLDAWQRRRSLGAPDSGLTARQPESSIARHFCARFRIREY